MDLPSLRCCLLFTAALLILGCAAPTTLGEEVRDDFWRRAPSSGLFSEPYPDWLEEHLEDHDLVGPYRPKIVILPGAEGRYVNYLFQSPAAEPRGTVLFMHGYFNHATGYDKIIRYLLAAGWNVAAPDLPGHGLNAGPRGAADGFEEYGLLVKRALDAAQARDPEGRLVLLSHSLGGAGILEYLLQSRESGTEAMADGIVLVNPLIRNRNYRLIQAARIAAEPFIDYFPVDLSNPYGVNAVPTRWLRELARFNRRLRKASPLHDELVILQSEGDRTVNWRYNLALLKEKLPRSTVQRIREGDHDLFWPDNEGLIFPLIEGLISVSIGLEGLNNLPGPVGKDAPYAELD